MKPRKDFKINPQLFTDLREKIKLYLERYPERVVAGMFIILLVAVAGLLLAKAMHQDTYSGSIDSISSKLRAPQKIKVNPGRSLSSEVMGVWQAYQQAQAINPDSITTKDSLLLKEIDKDLNSILDEKD